MLLAAEEKMVLSKDQEGRNLHLHNPAGRNAHPLTAIRRCDYSSLLLKGNFPKKRERENEDKTLTLIQLYSEHMSKFLFKSLNKMREQCRCHNRFKGEVKEQLPSQLGNVEMLLPMVPSLLPGDHVL